MVAEHVQPLVPVQVTDEKPRAWIDPAMPSQVTAVDDIVWHADENEKCSSPVVIVWSVNVPSAFAVQVPLTCRDPVTDGAGQLEPILLRLN